MSMTIPDGAFVVLLLAVAFFRARGVELEARGSATPSSLNDQDGDLTIRPLSP